MRPSFCRLFALLSPRRPGPWVCAVFAAAGITLAAACSNQAEGERCDVRADNGGNDDCKDGLACTPGSALNGNDHQTDRCCPLDRTRATTFVCQLPSSGAIDAAPPLETGAPDVSTDAPSPDAGADVNADTNAPDSNVADAPADG